MFVSFSLDSRNKIVKTRKTPLESYCVSMSEKLISVLKIFFHGQTVGLVTYNYEKRVRASQLSGVPEVKNAFILLRKIT